MIFFGSVHVTRAFPGASPYAATKGALETATGVLAAELGPKGVRVSCIRPGGVFSELNQRAGAQGKRRAGHDRAEGPQGLLGGGAADTHPAGRRFVQEALGGHLDHHRRVHPALHLAPPRQAPLPAQLLRRVHEYLVVKQRAQRRNGQQE